MKIELLECLVAVCVLQLSYVTCYLVTPHTDGKNGYTWYLFNGLNVYLPCNADKPKPADSKAISWQTPAWSRFTRNSSTGGLDLQNIKLPDSGMYICKDSSGAQQHHEVLVVEQPLSAYARVSIRYNLKAPCDPSVSADIVQATNMEACKTPGTAVDGACIVKTKGECRALVKIVEDYTFEFRVHNMIPSLNIEDFVQQAEAKAKCNTNQICVLDFKALQTIRYKEQTGLLEQIRKQIYAAIQRWVDEEAALLKKGYDPIEDPPLSIDSFARCSHSGYQWLHNVLCIPCSPGTYRMGDKPRASTPVKCLPCSTPSQQPAYGASNCFARPTVSPDKLIRPPDEEEDEETAQKQPYRVSIVQFVAVSCAIVIVVWCVLMIWFKRRQKKKSKQQKESTPSRQNLLKKEKSRSGTRLKKVDSKAANLLKDKYSSSSSKIKRVDSKITAVPKKKSNSVTKISKIDSSKTTDSFRKKKSNSLTRVGSIDSTKSTRGSYSSLATTSAPSLLLAQRKSSSSASRVQK